MAHLPGVEKLLRCMLVRDPARRATLADISRRVQKLLESVPVAQHIPEASLPAAMAPSRSDSTGTVWLLTARSTFEFSASLLREAGARGFDGDSPGCHLTICLCRLDSRGRGQDSEVVPQSVESSQYLQPHDCQGLCALRVERLKC